MFYYNLLAVSSFLDSLPHNRAGKFSFPQQKSNMWYTDCFSVYEMLTVPCDVACALKYLKIVTLFYAPNVKISIINWRKYFFCFSLIFQELPVHENYNFMLH